GKLLNPFPTSGGPRFTYPVTDTRRLRQRYAGELELYQQTTLARLGSTPTNSLVSLVGNQASFPPGTSTYRNDPAHGRRLMTTTLSADLDRPRLMTSATGDTKNSFALAASGPGIHPTNTGLQSSLSGVSPTPALSALDVNRPLADYRSDTSKSLSPTNVTTASANQAWADRHNLARDIFGRLILATAGTTSFDTKTGLLSVGASSNITATINPTTGDVTVKAASGSSELNGLRYLAQLAVNMVDYVDNDDVSTVFVWQPSGGGALTVVDATSVVNNANTALPANTQPNGDNVVFGFEVPRLVINETYAEITNDPADANLGANKTPPNPGQVRFWVELLNPAGNATKQSMYLGGSDGPLASPDGKLADGSVTLYVAAAHRPYRLQIAKGGTENAQLYQTPNNSAGELSATAAGTSPLVDFRFDSTDIVNNAAKQTVAPNNGSYTGATGIVVVGPSVQTFNGIEMKSDPSAAPWNGQTYLQSNPITAPIGSNAMGYQYATPVAAPAAPTASLPASNTLETYAANLGRHVVLLRRLANPYQPEAANNPYVTVDMMDYVPAHDAVHRASDNMTDRSARATPGTGTGYDTLTDRFAVGKVQPYAGLAADGTAAGGGKQATPAGFPTSFVIPQVANSNTSLPKCSLFRHNGKNDTGPTANTASGATPPTLNNGETLLAPFDWFFHPDRPLINELEFLGVQAVKPHEVTQYTFQPPLSGGPQIRRYNGLAPWLGVTTTGGAAQAQGFPTFDPPSGYPAFQSATATPALNVTGNGLYRAFELLRGKSRVFGTATGGRVQGKININTLQDSRVLIALLDAQPKNAFAGAEVFNSGNPADTTTIWGRFIASRTQGLSTRTLDDGTTQVFTTTPGKTIDDDPYDTAWQKLDRPFKSFGVAEAAQTKNNAGTIVGGGNVVATDTSSNPTPFGPGLQDTLLRVDPATRRPLAYTTGAAATHPYLQAEALRKLLNNTTTVSNVFCIHVTIVYHNVRLDPATPGSPLAEGVPGLNQTGVQRFFLGSEAFRDVPGDMRQQYLAIVDRSNAAIDVKNTTDANTVVPNSPTACQPFQAATSAGFTMTSGTGKFSLAGSTLNTGNGTIVVWHDGQAFTIPGSGSNGTNTLYVGSGQDRVQVTVTVNATTGELTATETNSGTTTRTFPAGALVSAGVSGRPTRPTGFSPTTPNHPFQLLVPYCGLVRAVASIK
ncbi:MAG TPA: hypothetical protein VH092_03870, partial [Urbifossiella sp.]|nr:hypothetical protein [Urbifossiella sp.]